MTKNKGGLTFLPLGGTGEIGMNFNLYGLEGKWLAIDCGIGFSGNDTPEADILLPDPAFIAERRKDLVGLVITHAHEDHIGAVAHLWPQLQCPVYVTPFGAAVLRAKLTEAQLLDRVKIHVMDEGQRFRIEPFDIQFLPVTHSVPEAQSVVLRTPYGVVLHTGDWKNDQSPLLGPPMNLEAFAALGREGVLAMVCDSTNVMTPGPSESEADVRQGMIELIAGLKGRVAVTCFASNIARIETIAKAAQAVGRRVILVGRSLRNMENAARECGYLLDVPEFFTERDTNSIPESEQLLIVTGSQGEPRSALTRIAADTHQSIALGEGDTVIYSSRMIPGNERAVMQVQDNLARRKVRVITDREYKVHVSGHATREDTRTLYTLVKPKFSIPVHGEWRHLNAHATLAHEVGITTVLMEDGDIASLSEDGVKVVDTAPVGRLALDGKRLLPMTGGVLASRRRMLFNGIIIVSIAIDDEGYIIGDPKISAPGLLDPEDQETDQAIEDFIQAIDDVPVELRLQAELFEEAVKVALRRALRRIMQKRPIVDVHLLYV